MVKGSVQSHINQLRINLSVMLIETQKFAKELETGCIYSFFKRTA
jgi:hypothetical protein